MKGDGLILDANTKKSVILKMPKFKIWKLIQFIKIKWRTELSSLNSECVISTCLKMIVGSDS